MFKIKMAESERSNCTTMYRIVLDREYDVKDFIEAVLSNRKNDWGYIGIKSNLNTIFGDPNIEYKDGKIIRIDSKSNSEIPFEAKVISVIANGGWSRMDYILTIG